MNEEITVLIDRIKFKTGDKVKCNIRGIKIDDAKIFLVEKDYIGNNIAYICQNKIEGSSCCNKFGYKYSLAFRVNNYNLSLISELRLVNVDELVSVVSNVFGVNNE